MPLVHVTPCDPATPIVKGLQVADTPSVPVEFIAIVSALGGIELLSYLLVSSGEGDRKAFDRLYGLTHAKLYGICLRVCGNAAGAEDVLAEVYLTIWNRAAIWQLGRASPITWMAIIARNRSIDWRRAQRPSEPLSNHIIEHTADPAPHSLTMLMSIESSSRTLLALDRLAPHKRDAIRSAFLDGLTYAELALRANVPLGTMKSWIRRGLAELRDTLDRSET